MVEFPDVDERRAMLERLIGIEDKVWVQVDGFDRIYAIADEDLERSDEKKTSAVHFLRFELTCRADRGIEVGRKRWQRASTTRTIRSRSPPIAENIDALLLIDLADLD